MKNNAREPGKQRLDFARLKQGILPVICLVATFFWYGTGELYLNNRGSEEFWFTFSELILPLAVISAGTAAVLLILLMLLPPKGYRAGVALITGISVLMLAQGIILPNGYGLLDGAEIDWSRYTGRAITNTAIWVALPAAAVVFAIRKWDSFHSVARFASCILLAAEAAILITIGFTCQKDTGKKYVYLTTENEFTVSDQGNTIVFVLDAFDSKLFCDLLEEYPEELSTSFGDFTFYRNTSGGATRTRYAIPFLLAGRTNDTGIPFADYLAESSRSSPLFRELRTGNYSTGFYTEYSLIDPTQTEAIGNLSDEGVLTSSSPWGLTGSLLKMTAFKYMPHILKPPFWMYSMELTQWRGEISGRQAYRTDDIHFYREMQAKGLTIEQAAPAFRFYHLKGAHSPFTMDENIQPVSRENCTIQKQSLGALRIVAAYIQQLKQLNVYDCSTVIVMADHGNREYVPHTCEQNPMLLVKRSGETKPFTVSEIPLSYRDMPSMLTDALRNCLDIEGKYIAEGTRYFYIAITTDDVETITEYASDGDASDAAGYLATGVVYTAPLTQ